jgi:GcrA cell cycle regulator
MSPPPARQPNPPPLTQEKIEYILGTGKKLLDLAPGECKWALNDVTDAADYFFCGQKAINGLPYCEHHAAKAYNRTPAQVLRDAGERFKKTKTWS